MDDLRQGPAPDQFHDDIVDVALSAHVVDADDVGMGQAGCRVGLLPEVIDELLVLGELGLQDLDRHQPVQEFVHGAVNDGHSAVTDLLQQFIASRQDLTAH